MTEAPSLLPGTSPSNKLLDIKGGKILLCFETTASEQWWGKCSLLKTSWTILGDEGNTDLCEAHPKAYRRASGFPEDGYNCQAKILLYSRIQQLSRIQKAATIFVDRRSSGLAVWHQSTQILDGKLKNSLVRSARVTSSPIWFITMPRTANHSFRQNH